MQPARILLGAIAVGVVIIVARLHVVASESQDWFSTKGIVTASYVGTGAIYPT